MLGLQRVPEHFDEDRLVPERPPELLDEDVVVEPAASVHWETHASREHVAAERLVGELGAVSVLRCPSFRGANVLSSAWTLNETSIVFDRCRVSMCRVAQFITATKYKTPRLTGTSVLSAHHMWLTRVIVRPQSR